MKAKDYLEKFYKDTKAGGDDRATFLLIVGFMDEAIELYKQRKCTGGDGLVSILREQNQKWTALCKLNPTFRKDGFIEFIKIKMPELNAFI